MSNINYFDLWQPGTSKYTREQILSGEKLPDFAMNIIWEHDINDTNAEIVSICPDRAPSIMCSSGGKIIFVALITSVYPEVPHLTTEDRRMMLFCKDRYHANIYYASVEIMPDGLLNRLKNHYIKKDGFNIRYSGLVEITSPLSNEWLQSTLNEIDELDPANAPTNDNEPIPDGVKFSLSMDDIEAYDLWEEKEQLPSFQSRLLEQIEQKKMSNQDFYNAALMDRKLFSAIKTNPEYQPKKDTAVACCFGLKLSLSEAEELLKLAGYSLSMSIPWDRIVYYCIKNGIYDLDTVNELLYEKREKCIRLK